MLLQMLFYNASQALYRHEQSCTTCAMQSVWLATRRQQFQSLHRLRPKRCSCLRVATMSQQLPVVLLSNKFVLVKAQHIRYADRLISRKLFVVFVTSLFIITLTRLARLLHTQIILCARATIVNNPESMIG